MLQEVFLIAVFHGIQPKTYLLAVPFSGKWICSVSGTLNKINTVTKQRKKYILYLHSYQKRNWSVFVNFNKITLCNFYWPCANHLRFEVCLFSLKSILLFIQAMLALHDTEIYFWFYFDRLIQTTCTLVTMTSDTCVTAMCCHTRFIIAEKQCLWTDGNLDSTQPWRSSNIQQAKRGSVSIFIVQPMLPVNPRNISRVRQLCCADHTASVRGKNTVSSEAT